MHVDLGAAGLLQGSGTSNMIWVRVRQQNVADFSGTFASLLDPLDNFLRTARQSCIDKRAAAG
jgi:hypothetical protein